MWSLVPKKSTDETKCRNGMKIVTHLGAAPDGLEDDEVRDLAEPWDVLSARKDAGADHRDPGKLRAAVAVTRHVLLLGSRCRKTGSDLTQAIKQA